MSSRDKGQAAERTAENLLEKHGFSLVKRNFRAKTGEIDLIMSRRDLLIFVEVRLRTNPGYGRGSETVDYRKQRKLIDTAHIFLQAHGMQWQSYRFDVVSIGPSVDWIEGAFTLD